MKKQRTIPELTPKVNDVLRVTLESVVPDLRPLSVALFLSTPDEVIRIRQTYPKGNVIYEALNAALAFHKDAALLEMYIADGFFNKQLEYILKVAKKNRMAGARLMPVFCTALTYAEELRIPAALQEKIIAHIEWQRRNDGFAIKELSLDKIVVVPADDVIPA